MESAKEKAIREAYGEHWETVKEQVNENGYLYHPRGGEVTFDPFIGFMEEHPTDDAYRPNSLQGIETNNGWTRIESEADLPNEDGYYEVCKDGVPQKNKSYYHSKFSGFKVSRGSKQITHWKTPIEVKSPIY